MSNFNIGPWRHYRDLPHTDRSEWKIRSVHGQPRGTEYVAKCSAAKGLSAEANARLIAAAPELLEALKNILREAELGREHGVVDCAAVADECRKAIAKSEGKQ